MREITFVRLYESEWREFERLLDTRRPDPDLMAGGYTRVMDDLAYARTFFPGSQTTSYLNALAGRIHQRLYRNKKEERGRLRRLLAEEVPLVLYEERRPLGAALLVFVLAVTVGALSQIGDASTARAILGDGYVNRTIENIDRGQPMAVYAEMDEGPMTLFIGINNIRVALNAFVFGITAGIGTAFVLAFNGLMVGAFFAFLGEYGVFWEAVRVVMLHGTLELGVIVVAGGAGFVVGRAMLFPGTYPRLYALRRGATRGLKIVMATVPVFVAAAIIEGYLTRQTGMPVWLSLLIISSSAFFLVWYFYLLPRHLSRKLSTRGATPGIVLEYAGS